MLDTAKIVSKWYKNSGYEGEGMPLTVEAVDDLLAYINAAEMRDNRGHYADENMIPSKYDEDGNEIYEEGGEY